MTDHDCACHGFAPPHIPPCSVVGGCGHLHRDEVTEAKFKGSAMCRESHGERPKEASFGALCVRHGTDLRDLMADVVDLCVAYAEGDAISPTRGEFTSGGRNPHPPIPISLNSFLIGNPGGDPVGVLPKRNAHPADPAKIESNGPDAPDIRGLVYQWVDELSVQLGKEWPPGDTLAKLDWLRLHLRDMTHRDDYPDFVTDLRSCRRALAAAIGEQPGPQALGKCPECNTPLFTDRDREVIRRRRAGEPVTGDDAKPITAAADKVTCQCGATWQGVGLTRLRLILHPNPPPPRLEAASEGNGWMVG